MRALRCRQVAELPVLAGADEVVAATASVFGQLAILVAPRGSEPSADNSRVYVHDGEQGWAVTRLTGPAIAYPLLDLLPDGGILIVGARCQRFRDGTAEDNAHVFDASGAHLRSFCLGDGIEHVGVDAAGTIWVSYFDEGVFGNLGWAEPIGAAGLLRFDSHGRRLWAYEPPSGADHIVDCYALNVDARTTWAYYYGQFPLVRITDGRAQAYLPTPVRGAALLLAYRDEVIFVGDYDDPVRLAACRLTDRGVQYDGDVLLLDPNGARLHSFHPVTARGSRLYLQVEGRILQVDLADQGDT